MINKGMVKGIEKDGRVRVQVYKDSACSHCSGCSEGSKINREELFKIDNFQVKPGDIVTFEMETKELMQAAMIVYIFPILGMFAGYALAAYTGKSEGISITYSFFALFLSFGIIFLYDRFFVRNKKRNSIVVIDVSHP